jgi:Heterokaryon incompatibility protein (HET)
MRLLRLEDGGKFSLVEFVGKNIPCYAVLSHTWGLGDEEVTFNDLVNGMGKSKAGYRKIDFCGQQAANDSLRFFWVDTCCIDKSSSAELSEAINSMFCWYQDAAMCICLTFQQAVLLETTSSPANGNRHLRQVNSLPVAGHFKSLLLRCRWNFSRTNSQPDFLFRKSYPVAEGADVMAPCHQVP